MKTTLLALALLLAFIATHSFAEATNEVTEASASEPDFSDLAAEATGESSATNAPAAEAPAAEAPAAEAPAAETPEAEAPEAEALPKTEAAPAADAPALREADTDEIDLEEIDDSAEAAKKPQIKAVSESAEFIDISCDEASLADILRQFRKTTKANIICDDSTNLQRRVSAELKHVPWLDALQSILNSRGFRLEERGNIYFVNEDKQLEPILTKTFILNHASADDVAKMFNENFGTKDAQGKLLKKMASPFSGANAVVVSGTEKVLNDCETIIKSIDRAVAQIYIEARFIELSTAAMHKLGVDWGQLKSWGASVKDISGSMDFANNHALTIGRDGSLSLSNGSRSESSTSASASSGAGASSTAENFLSSTSSRNRDFTEKRNSKRDTSEARAFSGTLSVDDFNLAISAFEKMDDVKVFSNPKIIVSNGKEANVDMTTKFPHIRLNSSYVDTGSHMTPNYTAEIKEIPGEDKLMFAKEAFFSWGITLSVKPRISPDGLITVEIVPTISQLDLDVTQDGFYHVAGEGNKSQEAESAYGKYPVIQVKRLSTEFTMKDGSTAVIGGLSKTTEEDTDSGIPYLRKIPWIGPKLFGWKSRDKIQKEIIVFVTVGIANPAELPKDAGLPTNAVIGREYVNGNRAEPGLSKDPVSKILAVDMRPVEEIHGENRKEAKKEEPAEKPEPVKGSVTITPSKEN